MKAVLTLEFDKLADLREAVQRLSLNNPTVNLQSLKPAAPASEQGVTQAPETPAEQPSSQGAPAAAASPDASQPQVSTARTAETPKPPRKPRADAGKPRGPHKANNDGAQAPAPQGQAAGEQQPGSSPDTVSPNSAAPQAMVTSTPGGQTLPPAAAADPSKLTIDDVRAAIARISGTKGLGMQGCMDILKEFNVLRVTDLKQEQYAKFIASANDKVAKAGA